MFPKFSFIKQEAKEGLSGIWLKSFAREFIHMIISGSSTVASCLSTLLYALYLLFAIKFTVGNSSGIASYGYLAVLILVGAAIFEFIRLLIGCGIRISMDRYYLSLANNPSDDPEEPIFGHMKYFANRFFMEAYRDIAVSFLTIFFIVPGIISEMKWSMANYIIAEDPDMRGSDAITESALMMDGYKMKFFCFNLSFLPWFLLCVFTGGLGLIYVLPYYNAAKAKFYYYIKNPTWKESENEDELVTLKAEKFSYKDFVDEFETKVDGKKH